MVSTQPGERRRQPGPVPLQVTHATIDQQFRPNDEARFVGGEEDRRLGNLDRQAHAADRNQFADIILHPLEFIRRQSEFIQGRRCGRTGAEAISSDPSPNEFPG